MSQTTNDTAVEVSLKLLLPLLASIVAVSPLAIDMYLPAMPLLAQELSTDMPTIQNSLSIYLLAFSLGLVFAGPLADKLPRRHMVLFGLTGFCFFSVLLIFAQTAEQFLVLRFCQAIVSSAAIVSVPGTIRERFQQNTAKGFSYVSMIMMLAPMLAPTIGSILLLHSWQAIFMFLAGYSLLVLIAAYKFLPEAKNNNNSKKLEFFKRYRVVFGHKAARLDILSSMLVSLAFFGFITSVTFVYMTVYKVAEFEFSVLFGCTVLGLMTAHFINTRLVTRLGSRKMMALGLSVGVTCASGLLLVNYLQSPLMYTVVTLIPLMGSISIMAVNADAMVLLQFSEEAGTATAVIGILRFGAGSLAGPLLAWFYDGTALPFAFLMWSCIFIVFLIQLTHLVRIKK